MKTHCFYIAVLFAATLGLAGCAERTAPPAPVVQLGTQIDSVAGAVMVRSGDTLWDISQRYALSLRDIIDRNDLKPPYQIQKGARLKLPPPRYYYVQPQDSLYAISRIFGVDVTSLVKQNNLRAPYRIKSGQKLVIPAAYSRGADTRALAVRDAPISSKARPTAKPVVHRGKTAKALERIETRKASFANTPQFRWPVQGKVISKYGAKPDGLYNDGINIAAPRGAPVQAAVNGVVAYVGDDLRSFGNLVLIRHDDGWMTAYAHLERVTVQRGQQVSAGDAIGNVGLTGAVDEPQLHFEIRRGSAALDPTQYL